MYDVTIIGAGISGCSLAYELSKYNVNAVLVEKENDVSIGTTKANSAIVNAGYDPEPGTDMAKYNVAGCAYTAEICKKLDVPYKNIGSLVVAFAEEEMATIQKLYDRGYSLVYFMSDTSTLALAAKAQVETFKKNNKQM